MNMVKVLPTDAELAVLAVLWRRGPSTVRTVHEELQDARLTAYTTTLKIMQLMLKKGLLKRDETARSHTYRPASKAERLQGKLVRNLIDRAFDGSASGLVLRALAERPAKQEELDRIRAFLDGEKNEP